MFKSEIAKNVIFRKNWKIPYTAKILQNTDFWLFSWWKKDLQPKSECGKILKKILYEKILEKKF